MLSTLRLIELFPYSSRRSAPPLSDYASFQKSNGLSSDYSECQGFNFIEGDGLQTEIIVNDPTPKANYCLVIQDGAVVSRWFVLEKARTTNYSAEQYRLSLRRDVLADCRSTWESAPAYIAKGHIGDPNSPFLFNHESMTFNQVKAEEIPLPDETGMQWIVGYIARNAALNQSSSAINGPALSLSGSESPLPNALQYNTIGAFEKAFGASVGNFTIVQAFTLRVLVSASFHSSSPIKTALYKYSSKYGMTTGYAGSMPDKKYDFSGEHTGEERAEAVLGKVDILALAGAAGYSNPALDSSVDRSLAGRTVYIASEKKNYRVVLEIDESQDPIFASAPSTSDTLFKRIAEEVQISGDDFTSAGDWEDGSFQLSASFLRATLKLEEIPSGEYQISLLDPNLRPHLEDAPYDMFCIPYSDGGTVVTSAGALTCSKEMAWSMAVLLVTSLASGTYDLQLLPYCPAREAIKFTSPTEGHVDCSELSTDFVYKGKGSKDSSGAYTSFERGAAVLPVIWCRNSSFSFQISSPLSSVDTNYPADAQRVKELNETRKLRLVSPNLAGGFDFSPMMNGGVTAFRADCTYKPFNPYIHVSPVFKFLYGGDFGDARGLVCGGDFSLPRVTDAWETYQQQNKNYQSIFDREIQNLEVAQKYQRVEEGFGIAAGTAQGIASGAAVGSVGGPIGAAVGAVVGGAASLAGGIADAVNNNALRAEAIDYRKDLFGYQLGNIKALPYSLAKTAALNANNRPFPFVEAYEATGEELEALRMKLRYNGMTVGAVGKPSDYFRPGHCDWIQCVPCGAPGEWPGVPAAEWTAVVEELSKGVFIYEEADQ